MKYKAVLFDLDGTLLDTIDDLTDSINAVLSRAGLPTHNREAVKYFVGDGIETLVTRALPSDKREKDTVAKLLKEMHSEYAVRWDKKTRPYKGIMELLYGLQSSGVMTAVLSNKPDKATREVINRFFKGYNFSVVRGQREDTPKKPDPTGAIEISKDINVPVSEFLYLGDTSTDMKTAIAAGMYPVGATWGFRTREELLENGARVLIDTPIELLNFL